MLKDSDFWSDINFFRKSEFTCRCGCSQNNISHSLVKLLNTARNISKTPFKIDSAYRCKEHNSSEEVKGSSTSSHLKGYAVDIRVTNSVHRFKILQALIFVGFKRIGVYKNFIHCDNDSDKVQNVIWYK